MLGQLFDSVTVLTVTQLAGSTVAAAVTTPFMAAVVALLYIDIRIRREADIRTAVAHERRQLAEVFRNRLWRAMEQPVGLHVDRKRLASEVGEELRHDGATRAMTAVQRDAELPCADSGDVEIRQRQNRAQVTFDRAGIVHHTTEPIPRGTRDSGVEQCPHRGALVG